MRSVPPAPADTKRKEAWSCKARVVLITRLFGGGAKTRTVDEISWLRSSAVKSALRAWWRAGHAHEFSSLETLRNREEKLFGASGTFGSDGTLKGGPGALEVTTQSHLAIPPTEYREPLSDPLNYALFPAQGMGQPAAKVAAASDQSSSSITLTSWSDEKAIHGLFLESLGLWLTLGGAGSRTRRGAGAVAAAKSVDARELGLPSSLRELEDFLRTHCKRQQVPGSLDGVFCLARTRRIFLGPTQTSGEEAQRKLLAALRGIRQDRPRPNGGWGRSRWPEADAIRLKEDPAKSWVHSPSAENAERYPRAALGLPIVVHFKDRAPTEPEEHQILGAQPHEKGWRKIERYSSPVLLRPVCVWEGKQTLYIPVAIFTDCTLPANVRPLVTTKPKGELAPSDVVSRYGILSHADETLLKIESAFEQAPGFRPLL